MRVYASELIRWGYMVGNGFWIATVRGAASFCSVESKSHFS
jgi:hypothetical protein